MIQLKVENQMILLERFITGGGWIEILVLSGFAVFLYIKMQNPAETSRWRTISWSVFAIFFFAQLLIGILWNDKFLMSADKVHIPVPAIILGGGLFRMKISFMPVLFISTIILTGPAWCSQLCYFGAFDNLLSRTKKKSGVLNKILLYRNIILLVFIITVLLFRLFNASYIIAGIFGGAFGIAGLLIILLISPKRGAMVHCVMYCPIGTLVSYLKYINPFRMYIDNNCTDCQACSSSCKYSALTMNNISNRKPGLSCTYCGDCIQHCHSNSIKYKLFGLRSDKARDIYLIITIAIFVVFLGVARM